MKAFISCLCFFILIGCTTLDDPAWITKKADQISEAGDEVTRTEAKYLAQAFALNHNLAQNFDLMKYNIQLNDELGVWWVDFGSRFGMHSRKQDQGTLRVAVSMYDPQIIEFQIFPPSN